MFTVVIPARNRADLVTRAIDSALAQTEPPDEVIVVDDDSSDGTREVAAAAGARVLPVSPAGGSGPARNVGVQAAASEWIAFLDSDDEWDNDHLESLRAVASDRVLVSAPSRSASGLVRGIESDRTTELTSRDVYAAVNSLVTSGTAVRRDVLLDVGGFRPLPRAQDFDCWLRILERGRGLATGRATVTYHEHSGQVSLHADLNRVCILQILDDYADRPWAGRALQRNAIARFYWDDLRRGQRNGQRRRIVMTVRGAVSRPAVLPVISALAIRGALRKFRSPSV